MSCYDTMALAVLALSGCSIAVQIPPEDAFKPAQVAPKIEVQWVSADNPTAECKRRFPGTHLDLRYVIPACSGWDHTKNTCTIVTGSETSHQILGHELRHCFEGDFHKDKP